MKTAVLTVKVDDDVKARAQSVAKAVGIPLSTLVNAYLVDLGTTGQVHFAAPEPMTPKMEKIIEQAEREIAAGETSGPFDTDEDLFHYLDKL